MSPIDPISPVSPNAVSSDQDSPTTPKKVGQSFQFPPAPQISATLHLPKLVTSFNTSVNIRHIKESSTQFKLQTPSPLKLDKSPQTAILSTFSPGHRRTGAISERNDGPPEVSFPADVALAEEFIVENGTWISTVGNCEESEQFVAEEESNMDSLEEIEVYMDTPIVRRKFQLPLRTTAVQDSIRMSPQPPYSCYPPSYQDNISLPQCPSSKSQSSSVCVYPTSNRSNRSSMSKRRSSSSTVRGRLPRRCSSSTRKLDTAPFLVVQNSNQIHLANSVAHMRTPLVPLISVRTGLAHPEFPTSILQYHLLTHSQLDSLACWYHQTLDAGRQRWFYPAPIKQGKAWAFSSSVSDSQRRRLLQQETGSSIGNADVSLETKRRRWGRFIGLRGCESPVEEDGDGEEVDVVMEDAETSGQQQEESLAARMEREWREALRRAEDENRVMDKIWKGRF